MTKWACLQPWFKVLGHFRKFVLFCFHTLQNQHVFFKNWVNVVITAYFCCPSLPQAMSIVLKRDLKE